MAKIQPRAGFWPQLDKTWSGPRVLGQHSLEGRVLGQHSLEGCCGHSLERRTGHSVTSTPFFCYYTHTSVMYLAHCRRQLRRQRQLRRPRQLRRQRQRQRQCRRQCMEYRHVFKNLGFLWSSQKDHHRTIQFNISTIHTIAHSIE